MTSISRKGFVLAALAAVLVTGCSKSESGPSGGGGGVPPTRKEVQLQTWSNYPTVNFFKSLVVGFEAKYPEYKLVITDVPDADIEQANRTRVSAGNVDIICNQSFVQRQEDWNRKFFDPQVWQQYCDANLLVDLTNQPFMSKYSQKARDDNSYNGKNYMVPTAMAVVNGVYYNKEIFAELNLSVPETWDQFIALCEKVKASKKYGVLTLGGQDQWPLNMFGTGILSSIYPQEEIIQLGKDLLAGTAHFTDPKILKLYECMEQFASYLDPGVTGILYQDAPGIFVSGATAMLPSMGPQGAYIIEADPDFDFGFFPLPGFTKRSDGLPAQFPIKYDLSFSIPTNAPNQDGALKFLDYFTEKENYARYLDAVGFSSTQPDVEPSSQFLKDMAPYLQKPLIQVGVYLYTPKGAGQYARAAWSFTYLKAAGGTMDRNEFARAVEKDWQDALKALSSL
jgi:raffinose/stachyose/melibiose transport system substrate-binding protein